LYGPNGAQLDVNLNTAVAEVEVRATNTGTFLLVAADGRVGLANRGVYPLTLAKTGSPISISDGHEGGPLTNGLTYPATIRIGDLDTWTITAAAEENMLLRLRETVPVPYTTLFRSLYGPNGAQLDVNLNTAVAEVEVRATNTGTFLLVVADG